MDENDWIFLSTAEVLDAIALDFQMYGSQPMLFSSLLRLFPAMPAMGNRENTRTGLLCSSGRPVPEMDPERMGFFILHHLEARAGSSDLLAKAAALVFDTETKTGRSNRSKGLWIRHGMAGFTCARCGRCCKGLAHHATLDDVAQWQSLGRDDILEWVKDLGEGRFQIWVDPETGQLSEICPWLGRNAGTNGYRCRIQAVKPVTCRDYPFTPKHAAMTGCRGRFSP